MVPKHSLLMYFTLTFTRHKSSKLEGSGPPLRTSGEPGRQGTMRGCGVVAWCAVMTAVFLRGLCGSSDTVMASVLRHQAHQHVARGGCHTGLYKRPAGVQWGGCAKALGSSMWYIRC